MNGILLIDKPEGWTSMDVCAKLRGALQEKRVGHSGTLDPMATGLLVVFLGRATRAASFAEADDKTYEARLRLGIDTDTQDVTGTILSEAQSCVTDEAIDEALSHFRGELLQIPPMYSAIRINGQRLYDLARKGKEVSRPPRRIRILSLEQHGRDEAGDILLTVRCSKGTYIRTLCHDIGAYLGCGGAMSALRRVRAGAFDISMAHTLEEILVAAGKGAVASFLQPVDKLFSDCDAVTLTPAQEKTVRNGGYCIWTDAPETRLRLYGESGEFLALGEIRDGILRPIKSFYEV